MATLENERTPAPLERRPEARAFKIETLLDELSRGRVRVPDFQRPLRWNRGDARKLIDSIFRGYPIGTLLFWETATEPTQIAFGSVSIDSAGRTDALLVVDGQQRIVSLARVLLPRDPDADEFALYFDLDNSEFISPPNNEQKQSDPSRWLPLTDVLDSEKLIQWILKQAPQNKKRRDRAVQLGKRIREYEVPAYLVRSDSEGILREVFGRINSAGKKLRATEVFDALHGAKSSPRPSSIIQISQELENLHFGHVEEDKVLYRMLLVILGLDITKGRSTAPVRLKDEDATYAYRQTTEAARRVIQFFKQDVGIPHYAVLPYKQPFVTLGKFFHHFPNPKPRSRQLLARWVWRGALNGSHSGNAVSTRRTHDRIIPNDESRSVQALLNQAGRQEIAPPSASSPFNFRYATSKLQTLALIDLEPRDLETGKKLDLGQYFDHSLSEGEPILTRIIRSNHQTYRALGQSISNRLLAHRQQHRLRMQLANARNSSILLSHGITEEASRLINHDDIPNFLSLRSEFLNNHFRSFFAGRARWNESDRPAIDSLIVTDEDN